MTKALRSINFEAALKNRKGYKLMEFEKNVAQKRSKKRWPKKFVKVVTMILKTIHYI